MQYLKFYYSLVSLLMITGCAQLTHFNDVENVEGNVAIMMDAKQRGVYYWERQDDAEKIMKGFCAEPSPDAVSAMAATLGLDLTVTDKGKLGLSQSLAEGVGNIGIRTAAIQALRDIMYRNCEAFAMGGITEYGLETLQRRFQSTMVAILAIEQLTGAVRANPIVISSDASLGSPEAIIEITKSTEIARLAWEDAKTSEEKQKKKVDEQANSLKTAETAATDFNAEIEAIKKKKEEDLTPDEKAKLAAEEAKRKELNEKVETEKTAKESLESELSSLSKSTKEKKQAYDAVESARVAAISGGGKSSTSVKEGTFSSHNSLDKDSVQQIASAIKEIVTSTTNLSYYTEVCTTVIGQNADKKPTKGSPLEMCRNLLAAADNSELQRTLFAGVMSESYPGISGWSTDEIPKEEISKEEIESLQKLLNKEGFKDENGKELAVDGKLGKTTKFAIESVKSSCDVKMRKPFPKLISSNMNEIFHYITMCKL